MLEQLRQELYELHLELPKNNLVAWTSGNVSARDPGTGLVVIKPSGVRYERLRPEHMVVVDLDGKLIEGTLKPSSDTASHLYIYRHRPDVGGVVHTHSTYASAFAAVDRPIPVYLTAQADEFGGPIPCGGFALIGGEEIGQVVLEAIGNSCAVLLKNHGVAVTGASIEETVVGTIMLENAAMIQMIAEAAGTPAPEFSASDIAQLQHEVSRPDQFIVNFDYLVRRAKHRS